jgi:hypothetical protein
MTADETNDKPGYVNGEYQSILPDQLGPWTQQESINYEVAEDLFGDLIADCAARIHEAETADPPDLVAAKRWGREQAEWARQRRILPFATAEEIENIIETYSPIVRARYSEELQSDRDFRESHRP